ncbi:hypothetical protein PV05_10794 [Exophiala xenobiotica]|uniref:Uncharacterized protein n=1 Tax=Exophiala xenobiotica TaxID=348802 RepID=A0A0D2CGX5_9EURO|nr:uncharacterized protein PV05_10794 [Exophiala xenobiotica]KIW49082.1 hypothetical protein PV05_10794 [Exophiala xenobiotica]
MPGIPLDAMDKLKALFKRKKDKTDSSTAGTKTDTPAGAAVPKPTEPAKPTTSDPTTAPAGAAPVDAPPVDKPTETAPAAPTEPAAAEPAK